MDTLKFIKKIKKLGYEHNRNCRSSHQIWENPTTKHKMTIVIGRKAINKMIARRLLKEAKEAKEKNELMEDCNAV
jgi:predicted RNA binding protein YcfA (HicA-like mRNA interferase family)